MSTTATYDDQDRLLTYNTLSFGYNHNGERTSRVDSSTSQTTGYTYNALGQLESVTLPSADVIEYAYDGLGRRVGRSLNSTVTHMFVYEGDLRIIADLNPSTGNIETRYVYVSQSHSPDYMMRGGQEYEFVKDHLGSVKLVVRVSDGVVMQNITYDEFGRVLSGSNPGFQLFGFAGGVYDAQTGLTKFGVRDYDAEVGRWLTKDPILFHGGDANLYGYVMMDPVNWVDLQGTGPIGFGACAAIAAISGFGLLKDTSTLKKQLDANRKEAASCEAGSDEHLALNQEYLRLNQQYAKDQGINQAISYAVGVACVGLIASTW